MSDVSQGPGWWLARDGRCYPPELHPDVSSEHEAAPPVERRKPLSELAPAFPADRRGTGSATEAEWALAYHAGSYEPKRKSEPNAELYHRGPGDRVPVRIKLHPTIVDLPSKELLQPVIPGGYCRPVSFVADSPRDPSGFPTIPPNPAVIQALASVDRLSTRAGRSPGNTGLDLCEPAEEIESYHAPMTAWKNAMPRPRAERRGNYLPVVSGTTTLVGHLVGVDPAPALATGSGAARSPRPRGIDHDTATSWTSTSRRRPWRQAIKLAPWLMVATVVAAESARLSIHP